jgi:cell wall-associated NlpC family hydrolase
MKKAVHVIPVLCALACMTALVSAQTPAPADLRKNILATAHRLVGIQYVLGGSSETGFDCSGYVKFVYEKNGIVLPRTAPAQYAKGVKIPLEKAKPADLVFFDIFKMGISHVGIYLGDKKFIHAPSPGGAVHVAVIDQYYWQDRLVGAASFIEDTVPPQKEQKKP